MMSDEAVNGLMVVRRPHDAAAVLGLASPRVSRIRMRIAEKGLG